MSDREERLLQCRLEGPPDNLHLPTCALGFPLEGQEQIWLPERKPSFFSSLKVMEPGHFISRPLPTLLGLEIVARC